MRLYLECEKYPPVAKICEVSEPTRSVGVISYLDSCECTKDKGSATGRSAISFECNDRHDVLPRKLQGFVPTFR